MKNKFLILATTILGISLSSCVDMDLTPESTMTSDQLANDPTGIEYATIGAYRW